MKIRTAIFGVYLAATAVGFVILMALMLRDVRLRYVESTRRTLADTAAFLAAVAEDGGERADGRWAERLALLPAKADLLRVFATDVSGRVLFDSAGGHDLGHVYEWAGIKGNFLSSEDPSAAHAMVVEGELRVRAPVRRGGELIGYVGVGRPLATVTGAITRARWRLALIGLSVAAVMVAAGWWIAAKLTHSLERLTAYAQAVRDGRAATPPGSRAREIAALTRAFEEMRVTLEGKAHVERYTQALAHEFKAPLSAIRGAAELLAEDMPREDRVRFIGNLRAESDRLQLIVERMLELSALEARRAGSMAEPEVELRGVVAEACDAARAAASAKRVTVTLSAGDRPRVRGEKFLLGQAVGNLVQNAVQFSPAGGAVTVEISVREGMARVSVADTGPGVPEFAREKVFERFYSLPRPDTGRKSSGLGLSIVREIARLHGGEVTLENRREGGALAVLTLPAA